MERVPVGRKISEISRRLSISVGWTVPVSHQEIVTQAKLLCRDYVKGRLRRAGIVNRKLPNFIGIPSDVSLELMNIGLELENLYPKLYTNICRHINTTITSEAVVYEALGNISHHILENGITWGKIISIYAVAGALAVDCVRQGHSDYVQLVVDCIGDIVERELVEWISNQGGWIDLILQFKAPKDPLFYGL